MLDAVVPFPFFVEPGIKIRPAPSQNFSSVLDFFNHDICIDLLNNYAIWSVEFLLNNIQNQAVSPIP
jgi:hypothetical protein